MSLVWRGSPELEFRRPGPADLCRAVLRGVPLALLLSGGLALNWMVRLVERPLCHPRTPVSPGITVVVCRVALWLIGLRLEVAGTARSGPGAVLANHSSWLDILVLNSRQRVVFVSKAEVASWPGIGALARATGTLFIRREARAEVAEQARAITERLGRGQTLVLFPEGTSTDNQQVLPFKPALLAGLLAAGAPEGVAVQPVTLRYDAPPSQDPRFYAWFGDMDFAPHALAVLSARRRGQVRLTYHPPIPVAGRDRKSIAAEAERAVRSAF
ncbi:lysophospholipid acyltransferase family protein [Rubellimicrobium arenae]|uniref:lysophospholipid acyltransferase family protein n=1 Tax=Rubellimicrobium arenae TaxID=2817372 RepID=UPI001B310B4B|nr:lysophospholipid acyltransferase family protein [Rubellimicrobium arenae]